jgi:hypothetical protein
MHARALLRTTSRVAAGGAVDLSWLLARSLACLATDDRLTGTCALCHVDGLDIVTFCTRRRVRLTNAHSFYMITSLKKDRVQGRSTFSLSHFLLYFFLHVPFVPLFSLFIFPEK